MGASQAALMLRVRTGLSGREPTGTKPGDMLDSGRGNACKLRAGGAQNLDTHEQPVM